MRGEQDIGFLAHQRDAPQSGDAARERYVWLQNIDTARIDHVAEFVELAVHLAGSDPNVHHLAQALHSGEVASPQRFLHPIDTEPLKLARHRHCILELPWLLDIPYHPPAL